MSNEIKEMPDTIYAYHEENGLNTIYFGKWESDISVFDKQQKPVKYIKVEENK